MKAILICVLVICFEIVELIPYNNEEWARQREYRGSNWPVNQNLSKQYQSPSFTRPQTPLNNALKQSDDQRYVQQRRIVEPYRIRNQHERLIENILNPNLGSIQKPSQNQYVKPTSMSPLPGNEYFLRGTASDPHRAFVQSQIPFQNWYVKPAYPSIVPENAHILRGTVPEPQRAFVQSEIPFQNGYVKPASTSVPPENEYLLRGTTTEPFHALENTAKASYRSSVHNPYQERNRNPPFMRYIRPQQRWVDNSKLLRGTTSSSLGAAIGSSNPKRQEYKHSYIKSPERYDFQHTITKPQIKDNLSSQKQSYLVIHPSGVAVFLDDVKSITENNQTVTMNKAGETIPNESKSKANIETTNNPQIPVPTLILNPVQEQMSPPIKTMRVYPESVTEKRYVVQTVVNPFITLHKPNDLIINSPIRENSTNQNHVATTITTNDFNKPTATPSPIDRSNITQSKYDNVITSLVKPVNEEFITESPLTFNIERANSTLTSFRERNKNNSQPIHIKSDKVQDHKIEKYVKKGTNILPVIDKEPVKESTVLQRNDTNNAIIVHIPTNNNISNIVDNQTASQPMKYLKNDIETKTVTPSGNPHVSDVKGYVNVVDSTTSSDGLLKPNKTASDSYLNTPNQIEQNITNIKSPKDWVAKRVNDHPTMFSPDPSVARYTDISSFIPAQPSNNPQLSSLNKRKHNDTFGILPEHVISNKTNGNSVSESSPKVIRYTDITGVLSLSDISIPEPISASNKVHPHISDIIKNNDSSTILPAEETTKGPSTRPWSRQIPPFKRYTYIVLPTVNNTKNISESPQFSNSGYTDPSKTNDTHEVSTKSPADDTTKKPHDISGTFSISPGEKSYTDLNSFTAPSVYVSESTQTSIHPASTPPAEDETKVENDTSMPNNKYDNSIISHSEVVTQKENDENTFDTNEPAKLGEVKERRLENFTDVTPGHDDTARTHVQKDTIPSDVTTEKNINDDVTTKNIIDKTMKQPLIPEIDVSDLKKVDKPVVWFQPKDDFWETLSNDKTSDVVFFFQVHTSPIVEKDTKSTIYPNGTIVQELIETIKGDNEDAEPKIMKIIKVTNPSDTKL